VSWAKEEATLKAMDAAMRRRGDVFIAVLLGAVAGRWSNDQLYKPIAASHFVWLTYCYQIH
jgi:hypothetical protein